MEFKVQERACVEGPSVIVEKPKGAGNEHGQIERENLEIPQPEAPRAQVKWLKLF